VTTKPTRRRRSETCWHCCDIAVTLLGRREGEAQILKSILCNDFIKYIDQGADFLEKKIHKEQLSP
jgi:hypothetical protein